MLPSPSIKKKKKYKIYKSIKKVKRFNKIIIEML